MKGGTIVSVYKAELLITHKVSTKLVAVKERRIFEEKKEKTQSPQSFFHKDHKKS